MDSLGRARSNAILIAGQGIQNSQSQIKRTDLEGQRNCTTIAMGVNQLAQNLFPPQQETPQLHTSFQTFGHSNVHQLSKELDQKGAENLQFPNPSTTFRPNTFFDNEIDDQRFGDISSTSSHVEQDSKELDGLPETMTTTSNSFTPQFNVSPEDELEAAKESAEIVKLRNLQENSEEFNKSVNVYIHQIQTITAKTDKNQISAWNAKLLESEKTILKFIEKNPFDFNNPKHLIEFFKIQLSMKNALAQLKAINSSKTKIAQEHLDKLTSLNKSHILPANIINNKQLETWQKFNLKFFHANRKIALDKLKHTSIQEGTVILARATSQTDCTFVLSQISENDEKHVKININENGKFQQPGSSLSFDSLKEYLLYHMSNFTPPLTLIQNDGSLLQLSPDKEAKEQSEVKERRSKNNAEISTQTSSISLEHNNTEVYDHQLILNLGKGDTRNNLIAKANLEGRDIHTIELRNATLETLAKTLTEKDKKVLAELTHNSCIHIIGHGSPGTTFISSDEGTRFSIEDYNNLLSTYCPKLKQDAIKLSDGHFVNVKINVIACYGGAKPPQKGSESANNVLKQILSFSQNLIEKGKEVNIYARSFGREKAVRRNAMGQEIDGNLAGNYASALSITGEKLPPGQLRTARVARPDASRRPSPPHSLREQEQMGGVPQLEINQALERYRKIESLNKLEEELKELIKANPNFNFKLSDTTNFVPYDPILHPKYFNLTENIEKLKKELSS